MARLASLFAAALLWALPAHAATITTTAPGDTGMIFVEGQIEESDAYVFAEAATRFRTAVVSLESNGGNLLGGLAMGRQIRERGFETLVSQGATCASVCATVWLSGERRSAAGGSRIGFHSSYLVRDGKAEASAKGNEVHANYLRSIGVPEATISYIMMAAPGSMTWLTDDAAKSLGIRYALVGGTAPKPAATLTETRGTPVVYRDLKVRAAAFTKPSKGVDSCRIVVLAEGSSDEHAFVTIDIPRAGGQPSVTFRTAALHADGQPRTVAADGDVFELAVGSNSGEIPALAARRFMTAVQATPSIRMVALRPDGSTVGYDFGVEGLRTAMQRTAKACRAA